VLQDIIWNLTKFAVFIR